MHYSDYEEKIVQHYRVELIGWTYEKLVKLVMGRGNPGVSSGWPWPLPLKTLTLGWGKGKGKGQGIWGVER